MAALPDTRDFDGFFRIEYPKLVALAVGLTGDHETACELAQEALLRCHRGWPRVSTMDVPGAWVRRVLINLATDLLRSRGRARRVPDWAHTIDTTTYADPVIGGWWLAVQALPDRQRAVVMLHYIEDRSVLNAAEVLGIAEGTVKATLAKARRTLARTMTKEA